MPSFGPKLESAIKVMRHRMAKNDQKFTKICFSRELSLKSGKINFHEFWTIFGHSTVHHLKKTPKITPKLDLQKKTVSTEIAKNAKFLFSTSHKSPKYVQKIKIFLPNNVSYPQTHRKKFLQASEQYSRNEPQIPEKKNVSTEIRTRLKSLPNVIKVYFFPSEILQ